MHLKILLIFAIVLLVHLCLIYLSRSDGMTEKLIVDTDAGGDDAVALLLALAVPDKLDILAITCTYGNTNESNVQTNVLKVLTVAERSDISVYAGAKKPLLQNYTPGDYFGNDGLGDFEFDRDIIGTIDTSKHAALAMVDLVKQYPGEISILTLGPLTNLALAVSLYPNFAENVKRIYVMGSTINEEDPLNPKDPEVEFNFSLDSEANDIVLNSMTKLKSLVAPWDVAVKSAISKEWRKEVLGKLDSERVKFLNQAEFAVLERLGVWYSADSIAVATMIWPELITSSVEARMSPFATCGPHKGAVKLDFEGLTNVEVVRDFDVEGFKKKLMRHLA